MRVSNCKSDDGNNNNKVVSDANSQKGKNVKKAVRKDTFKAGG